MNNLNIYHNLYEKSLDLFHSLVNLQKYLLVLVYVVYHHIVQYIFINKEHFSFIILKILKIFFARIIFEKKIQYLFYHFDH